jgi:hypothetical protein
MFVQNYKFKNMGNLNIDLETARQKFDESPEWLKLEMYKAFGTDFNKQYNYTDIKSFEDACRVLNIDPTFVDGSSFSKDNIAYEKMKVIIKAINGVDWKADFSDTNQVKFYNWYIYTGSGLRFSYSLTYYGNTSTDIGARLCFESREKAEYFGKTFINLINEYLN